MASTLDFLKRILGDRSVTVGEFDEGIDDPAANAKHLNLARQQACGDSIVSIGYESGLANTGDNVIAFGCEPF